MEAEVAPSGVSLLSSLCLHMAFLPASYCSRDSNYIGLRPTHKTHSHLTSLLKGPISKYTHIPRYPRSAHNTEEVTSKLEFEEKVRVH
jgi:hypothetical protein